MLPEIVNAEWSPCPHLDARTFHCIFSRRGVTEWLGGHLTASQGQPTIPSNPQLSNWATEMLCGTTQRTQRSQDTLHQLLFPSPPTQSLCHRRTPDQSGAICPLQSHVAASDHLPVILTPWHSFQEDVIHDFIRHRNIWLVDGAQGPIFTLLEIRCDISLFLVTGDFAWLPWLYKYDGEKLSNYICQFPLMHNSSSWK